MALTLYSHPLASFCHKVLIALYESGTPFDNYRVDLIDDAARARYLDLWPVGKMPVLRDDARDVTLPETTIIVEYLDRHYPGARPMLPVDPEARLEVRLWDRFFDLYVQGPMQKLVTDKRRASDSRDPEGVAEALATLRTAYDMIESRMAMRTWVMGDDFSLADCAAAPGLFFAGIIVPLADTHPAAAAYFERLLQRPSFRRVLDEARPYFPLFPYVELMPARFLEAS